MVCNFGDELFSEFVAAVMLDPASCSNVLLARPYFAISLANRSGKRDYNISVLLCCLRSLSTVSLLAS